LGDVLGKIGQYEKGFQLTRKAYFLKDSLFLVSKAEEIAELQAKFETAEKDLEISKKNLENTRLWNVLAALGISLLILSIGFLLYRQRQRRKLEAERQQAEKAQFRAVLAAEEQERRRIAGELHDGIGQLLSTTKLQLSNISHIPESSQTDFLSALHLLDDSVVEVRQISHKLAPPALLRGGLLKALRDLARMVQKTDKTSFVTNFSQLSHISTEQEIHLYRIIQELVNNSLKYAACSQIKLTITEIADELHIYFEDNGKGFDVDHMLGQGSGLGWQSILGRLKLLEGEAQLESNVNAGTHVTIVLPLQEAEN